jgi:glycosyltransferase involved in cell wall biosynthesis
MSALSAENQGTLPAVSVVMPCLNEERTVSRCVQAALFGIANLGIPGEVVVSDNGSTDNSVSIAAAAGARVVHCRQRGYGYAVRYGVQHTLGRWIIMGDADESYDFNCLLPFVERLKSGADVVIGNRFRGGISPGAMPWKNRYIGNPILTRILNALFHTSVGDSQCGLRAFSREAFELMGLETGGMDLASEMLVKASFCQLSVTEVPVTLDRDGRGRPPHLAPWFDGLRILSLLVRSRFAPRLSGSLRERTPRPGARRRAFDAL